MNIESPKFSCDVDGILNDYPICWLRFLAEKTGNLYETVSLAKQYEKDYKRLKDEYRNSSYKANLPVWRKNRDVINTLVSKGLELVVVTSRPILDKKYPDLHSRTIQWLKNNDIFFSEFEYKDPDAGFLDKYSHILFHIDDDPVYAQKVALRGFKVYLLKNNNWDFSGVINHENIVIVNNIEEISGYESIF